MVKRERVAVLGILFAGLLLATADPGARSSNLERRIDALIAQMTLEEKFGQLQQLDGHADGRFRDEHLALARAGRLGSTLNVRGAAHVNPLQRAALESRLKIPLIFAFDVIHGYRTVFPIPLGEAASWDPAAVERAAAIAAAETRAAGVHWTFAPMLDVARDARWGRMAEGSGEDPFLGAALGRARVRGFQGDDYSRPDKVVACAKHWVAYGAAEAGRDYNTTDMSERTLRSVYFPPFRAAVDAGVGTVMSAFNDLNGVPATANPFTLTDVLRREWGFDGLVVSDYTSVLELVAHGVAADPGDAARLALSAGVDMEMVSTTYPTHGPRLVREGRLPETVVDEAVRRVLRVKLRAGVFDRPLVEEDLEGRTLLTPESRAAAREIAARSMVLLSNTGGALPLGEGLRRIAVVGPLADDGENMMGNWTGDGRKEDVVTVLQGLRAAAPAATITHARGVTLDLDVLTAAGLSRHAAADRAGIDEAITVATAADAIVLVIGESGAMSGEASSRTSLDLPGRQLELVERVVATGKPVVAVLMAGRPLAIGPLLDRVPAVLLAWFPGTEGGHAVADVLFGTVNPGGKLPVTFPRTVGQAPIAYNHKSTGRPPDPKNKYTSKYLDAEWTPLLPFGHGLSYTEFRFTTLQVSSAHVKPDGRLTVSVEVENVGPRAGDEVVQLYLQDPVASVTRPVQELRGFARVSLNPGERRRVEFPLATEHLGFYDRAMKWVVEPGMFNVRVGSSSVSGLIGSFEVVP